MRARRTYRDAMGFARREDGAALVEFALLLPVFLIFLAVTVEGSRTFWSYQTAIAGVRDAVRYAARSASADVCVNGETLNNLTAKVTDIVNKTASGDQIFPSSITVSSVSPTLTCVDGDFRINPAPVVTITAVLEISYPFKAVFDYVGIELLDVTTSISDSSRIYGV